MYYDSPMVPAAYNARAQYMFGADLLVAPVASARDPRTNVSSQPVWFPPTPALWVPLNASAPFFEGNATVTLNVALDQIPLFVPAGAIIPTYNTSRAAAFGSAARQVDGLEVLIHLPTTVDEKNATVYEDDGISNAHLEVNRAGRGGKALAFSTLLANFQDGCPALEVSYSLFFLLVFQATFARTVITVKPSHAQLFINIVTSGAAYAGFQEQRAYTFHIIDPAALNPKRWAVELPLVPAFHSWRR